MPALTLQQPGPALTVADLSSAMEQIAPTDLAESWDNVGLVLGAPAEALRGPVLVTIDLTSAVLDEAIAASASAIIAYHPPIFAPFKRLVGGDPKQALVLRAARAGISLYCCHTALDAAPGGLADWLADAALERPGAAGGDRRALQPSARTSPGAELKIVTYVQEKDVSKVREALASAGAGLIGKYEACSFSSPGVGTFLGTPGANPAIGHAGSLQAVNECRLEMVCSKRALALALTMLRQFHPYEEPGIDVYPLAPQPRRDTGVGRRVVLDHPANLATLASRLKQRLGVSHVQIGSAGSKPVSCIGVCPGSGGELMDAAIAEGCEVFITGEMKHHDVLAAVSRGMSVILAGHTRTERPYLAVLATRLGKLLPGVTIRVSAADADPLETV